MYTRVSTVMQIDGYSLEAPKNKMVKCGRRNSNMERKMVS